MISLTEELIYQIGLMMIDGVGDINAKSLVAYCGSASQVFKQNKAHLEKIPGIGQGCSKSILNSAKVLRRAEEEIRFIEKYKITPLFFTEAQYPSRLRYCSDSPALLYYKGSADL